MEWKKRNIKNVHILCTEFDEKNLQSLLDECGIQDCRTMLASDFAGFIMKFNPQKGLNWGTVWFIQNLMIMQRLHQVDNALKELKIAKQA